jgi:hypothetical protein
MIIVVYRQSGAFSSELSMLRNARELFRLRGVQESYLQSLRVLFRAFSVIFAINLPTYAQYFHHFIIYLHSPTCFGPWYLITP